MDAIEEAADQATLLLTKSDRRVPGYDREALMQGRTETDTIVLHDAMNGQMV